MADLGHACEHRRRPLGAVVEEGERDGEGGPRLPVLRPLDLDAGLHPLQGREAREARVGFEGLQFHGKRRDLRAGGQGRGDPLPLGSGGALRGKRPHGPRGGVAGTADAPGEGEAGGPRRGPGIEEVEFRRGHLLLDHGGVEGPALAAREALPRCVEEEAQNLHLPREEGEAVVVGADLHGEGGGLDGDVDGADGGLGDGGAQAGVGAVGPDAAGEEGVEVPGEAEVEGGGARTLHGAQGDGEDGVGEEPLLAGPGGGDPDAGESGLELRGGEEGAVEDVGEFEGGGRRTGLVEGALAVAELDGADGAQELHGRESLGGERTGGGARGGEEGGYGEGEGSGDGHGASSGGIGNAAARRGSGLDAEAEEGERGGGAGRRCGRGGEGGLRQGREGGGGGRQCGGGDGEDAAGVLGGGQGEVPAGFAGAVVGVGGGVGGRGFGPGSGGGASLPLQRDVALVTAIHAEDQPPRGPGDGAPEGEKRDERPEKAGPEHGRATVAGPVMDVNLGAPLRGTPSVSDAFRRPRHSAVAMSPRTP